MCSWGKTGAVTLNRRDVLQCAGKHHTLLLQGLGGPDGDLQAVCARLLAWWSPFCVRRHLARSAWQASVRTHAVP